jgi:hypothetical protein
LRVPLGTILSPLSSVIICLERLRAASGSQAMSNQAVLIAWDNLIIVFWRGQDGKIYY